MDDTEDAGARQSTREWLRSFARQWETPVYYGGREEKLEYMDRLVDAGLHPEVVRFALSNALGIAASPGANRNALQLDLAGQAMLTCDDDSVCRLGDLREGNQTVSLVGLATRWQETHFAPNRRAAQESVPEADCDLLAAHEQLLGKHLGELVPEPEARTLEVDVLGAKALAHLRGRKGRVLVTGSGVLGACGMPTVRGFLYSRGENRDRFLKAWRVRGGMDVSREVVYGVRRPVVASAAAFGTTTATGLDNRTLLPPFMPSGRGEDYIFGTMIERALEDGYFGFVPIALLHSPVVTKEWEPLTPTVKLYHVVLALLRAFGTPPIASDEGRLRALGRFFCDWGSLDRRSFSEWLHRWALEGIATTLDALRQQLSVYRDEPRYWSVEMRKLLVETESFALKEDVGAPTDMTDHRGEDVGLVVQRFLLRFGELLQSWPDIVSEAARLREDGCRLGRRMC